MTLRPFVCGALIVGGALAAMAPPCLGEERAAADTKTPEAAALVRQALDNEVAADGSGRQDSLRQARERDVGYAPARWHLAEVRVGEVWLPLSAAALRAATDDVLAQYRSQRDEAAGNAALELDLAQWCVKHEMPDRARLHFWHVLTNSKATEKQVASAAKHLDLVTAGGRVLARAELRREQEREKRLSKAIEKWLPELLRLQPDIDGSAGKKRDAAIQKLAAINDASVVAACEYFSNRHRQPFGEELVKLLARLDEPESTQTLLRFAVLSPSPVVRERAIEALKSRPIHDYMPTLLAGLIAPIQAQFGASVDRRGNVTFQQRFVRQGADANAVFDQRFVLRPRIVPVMRDQLLANAESRAAGSRPTALEAPQMEAAAELNLLFAEQQLAVDTVNVAASLNNRPVFAVLEKVTGQQLPHRPTMWWDWWNAYNEVHYPKPTYARSVAYQSFYARYLPTSPSFQDYVRRINQPRQGGSCFHAGTPVWTETGIRAIESIRPGDRVLSQDADSGELCFKVVIGTTVRPPTEASQLTVNGETITTTLGHPLWLTGTGWEMAKNIHPGDQLHGVHGIVNVNSVEPLGHKIEAHNLVVDDFNTYFVGNCGMLVHDNTYRQPTRAIVPGLVP